MKLTELDSFNHQCVWKCFIWKPEDAYIHRVNVIWGKEKASDPSPLSFERLHMQRRMLYRLHQAGKPSRTEYREALHSSEQKDDWLGPASQLTYSGEDASRLILSSRAPETLFVSGNLTLDTTILDPNSLPRNLYVYGNLTFHGWSMPSLPASMTVAGTLVFTMQPGSVPSENRCRLPDGLRVLKNLLLLNCIWLRSLPRDLYVGGELNLSWCTSLESLPNDLCVGDLILRNCSSLKSLPEGIRVKRRIDIGGTGITALPHSVENASLFWRGVPVDKEMFYHPEILTVERILAEQNVELRRVLLEIYGLERFVKTARARVLDRDSDAGGERRLLRISLPRDEALVCLEVRCPSTHAVYIIRVPPRIRNCRKAAAWIAGFDDVEKYKPLIET